MSTRRIHGPEMFIMLLALVGFVVVAGTAVSGLIAVIQWVLSPTAWETLVSGAPWLGAGAAIGFIAGCWYMEGEIDAE